MTFGGHRPVEEKRSLTRNIPYVRIGESKEAQVERIKSKVAPFLVVMAVGSVFAVTSPARAEETCHPMPDAVCNAEEWVRKCVINPIRYGYTDPTCRT